MPNTLSEEQRLDAVSRLTADLRSPDRKALTRLKALTKAAIAKRAAPQLSGAIARLARLQVDAETRENIRGLDLDDTDRILAPMEFARHDQRDDILEARVTGPLTALAGGERLGPFEVDGGRVFFDFFRPVKHYEIYVKGATEPAFVLPKACVPRYPGRGPLTIDLPQNTIWIRGDLMEAGLPVGAYVAITINSGSIFLPHPLKVDQNSGEVEAPLEATLMITLKAAQVSPVRAGCPSGAKVELPELKLNFGASGLEISGGEGTATAWQQAFSFGEPTGELNFIAPLWTLLIGYKVAPGSFEAGMIKSELVDFQACAEIIEGALTLPVVVANPSVLSEAEVSHGWAVRLRGMQARWYKTDDRFHVFEAWMGIGPPGTIIHAPQVKALDMPVQAVYRLWESAQSPGHRLPWQHRYDVEFLFHHACHVANGETLLTTGAADVRLDRPVETNGRPVQTPTTLGVMHQHKGAGPAEVILGALTGDADPTRFALQNALLWSTRAVAILANGSLRDRQFIDAGTAHVYFGVLGWAPTLPDPYVGNFRVCRPKAASPKGLTTARIAWIKPEDAVTSFLGDLGAPLVCEKPPTTGKPVPAPTSDDNPEIGPTQTEQDKRYLNKERLADWQAAQRREQGDRDQRVAIARHHNAQAKRDLGGFMDQRLGPTPPVLLLDVSTNQDLLGVALWGAVRQGEKPGTNPAGGTVTSVPPEYGHFPVDDLVVQTPVEAARLVTLPQIQWEPVRTLDADQDILTLGWFPTPLASATDGGATVLGSRHQALVPVIPGGVLEGTRKAFQNGSDVVFRTTLPFGIITVVEVTPKSTANRQADRYEINRPNFPNRDAAGGLQITAKAEGDRDPKGGVSPFFSGMTRQLLNGVDLASGAPLGISVLGATLGSDSSTESIFNNDMSANPRVPVTRFDLSGYGGSNFSKWENPFALFAETSKTQFQVLAGRTALEIIKVASVLHPWGIRVTREVIVERQAGGGVIRRDTGWQAVSPGLFDYRYTDTTVPAAPSPDIADYAFDAGIFKGLFNIRSIRPAPGVAFSHGPDTIVPYYFDADLMLDGLSKSTPALGILGWLQTEPTGVPAQADTLKTLIETQGSIGGPIDDMIEFGASKMPFRAQRIEVGMTRNGPTPLFVATVRGVPKFPKTGSWSVVKRPVASVPPEGGEAVPVAENRGAPIIRSYPVKYEATDTSSYTEPRLEPGATIGDWRIADAEDLLTPASPQNDYCLLQSTPTHAFLFPRPYARCAGPMRIRSTVKPELADVLARSTSKGAFPPPQNVIQLNANYHFDVGPEGSLALSAPVDIVGHSNALRLSGSEGHGCELTYDHSRLSLRINANDWSAEFTGIRIWSHLGGMSKASGAELNIVGSTTKQPQITEIDTLMHQDIENILTYLPIFGARDKLGPIDLGATNAKHEIKVEFGIVSEVPRGGWNVGGVLLKLSLGANQLIGFDMDTRTQQSSAVISAAFRGEFPLTGGGAGAGDVSVAACWYIIAQLEVAFSIVSTSGTVILENFDLAAFAGTGVKGEIGPFKAYAFLGIGFALSYDLDANKAKYGGLVVFEAGVSISIVEVKLRAELRGLISKNGVTKCDYSGSVKVQVDIFLIISISATYNVTGTKELE